MKVANILEPGVEESIVTSIFNIESVYKLGIILMIEFMEDYTFPPVFPYTLSEEEWKTI